MFQPVFFTGKKIYDLVWLRTKHGSTCTQCTVPGECTSTGTMTSTFNVLLLDLHFSAGPVPEGTSKSPSAGILTAAVEYLDTRTTRTIG